MARIPQLNIAGLASGLDTNTIIDQLISIERQPKTRVEQQQRVEEARQTALRDIKNRLGALKTAASALRDAGTWGDVQTVESSEATKVGASRTGGAAPGAYTVAITQLARAHQVGQTTALTAAGSADVLHLSVGGGAAVDVSIESGASLQTIADRINSTSSTPVYATVVSDKLYLSGRTTGASNTISVTSDGSLAADLSFSQTLSAQDAQFTVNGSSKTSASNTVTDAIIGLSLTLKSTTTTAATITVGAPAADTEKVKKAIDAFVKEYNQTVDFVRGKLTEKKVRDADTDSERARGLLFNDTGLTQMLSQLRQSVTNVVSGLPSAYDQFSEVGLSTGMSTASGQPSADAVAGKLTLDSGKLTERLATNFADVKNLFARTSTIDAQRGLSQRIDAIVATFADSGGIMDNRINAAGSQIDVLKKRAEGMEQRLNLRETQLRAQFTAMETALRNAQSQGEWLSGQLAGLQ